MPETEKPRETSPPASHYSGLRRRWLLNAVLLVMIGALAWLAIQRAGQEKEVTGPPLTVLAADAISQVRLERPGHEGITLEKNGNQWALTAPLRARANPFNIDNLLRLVSAPTQARFPAAGHELAKFGLAQPQARVRFGSDEVVFGSLHPLHSQIYVLYKSEIALIPGRYLGSALYPYTNFIDSRLFESDRKISAIKLPDFTLVQQNGTWQRQPPDKKLTSDRINEFAAEWQNARALHVEKYSGKEILDRIQITSAMNGKSDRLALGVIAYKPDFVLLRPDENLEYHFTEDTGKRLLELSGRNQGSGVITAPDP